jgi:hypothetical protein
MGLRNREVNKKYLRIKDGKFYVGKEEQAYDEMEGSIVSMRYKDEDYEGAPLRKLSIGIRDSDGDLYDLSINVESSNYSSLISFLKNVDINQPVTLHPKVEVGTREGKEFSRRSVLVSQNGVYAKSYFTKTGHQTPAWNTVKVGNKKVTDKSEYLEFLEDFVTTNFINKLQASTQPTVNMAAKQTAVTTTQDTDTDVFDEKLPWEVDED